MLNTNLLKQSSFFFSSKRTFQRYDNSVSIGDFSDKGVYGGILWWVKTTSSVQVEHYSQEKRKTFYLIFQWEGI